MFKFNNINLLITIHYKYFDKFNPKNTRLKFLAF